MRSNVESDKFTTVSYEAAPPRKRDFLRVLLGRWTPEVQRVERVTLAGFDRIVKQEWTGEKIQAQMDRDLLGMFETQDP